MGGMFFFFQAEDGIRDLVRSRGLGDVYKRQDLTQAQRDKVMARYRTKNLDVLVATDVAARGIDAVSYTHLTLPTSDLV